MRNCCMTAKHSLLIIVFALHATICNAEIYHCTDESGKAIYKDSPCSNDESTIEVIENSEKTAEQEEEITNNVPNNTFIGDDKPGKLIFSDNRRLSPPYKIKVNEVRIITETDDTLVVDVIYTYGHNIPEEKIKIFITPNHGYWSTQQVQAYRGKNVARASISLSRSNMKKAGVTRSFTNTLSVRFEHYKPKKYLGVIWSEIVKYEKNWILKR